MFGRKEDPALKLQKEMFDKQLAESRQANTIKAAVASDSEPINNAEKGDLIRWQQDLTDQITELAMELRNKYQDPETNEWKQRTQFIGYDEEGKEVHQVLEPLMNEYGVQMIIAECKPLMSRGLMMSNLTEERILDRLKRTMNTITHNLCINHLYYGFSWNSAKARHILNIIKNWIIAAPYRALNNGERHFQTTQNRRFETYTENAPIANQRLFGMFGKT